MRCRHHPLHPEELTTALQLVPEGVTPSSYLGLTPTLKHFNHLADYARHRFTTPAALVLPALSALVIPWVTWVRAVTPGHFAVCAAFRHAILSVRN